MSRKSKAVLWVVTKEFNIEVAKSRYLARIGEEAVYAITKEPMLELGGLTNILNRHVRKGDLILTSSLEDWGETLAN